MSDAAGSQQHAAFKACINEAAQRGKHLMDRLVHRVIASMPQRDALAVDPAERKLQTESQQMLMQHRMALCDAYPAALLAEFAQAISGGKRAAADALSFGALELMGDDQVQESVEILRARQASELAVEPVLGDLNALVSSAMGLGAVQAERNPLRPEIYVRGLHSVIVGTGVRLPVRLRWMQFFGEALGTELAVDYAALSRLLRDQGVTEAEFNVVQAPGVATLAAPPAAAAAPAMAQTQINIGQLKRLLAGEVHTEDDALGLGMSAGAAPDADHSPVADFSHTLPAAYEALTEMKQVGKVVDRLAQRNAAPQVAAAGTSAALRQSMRGEAKSPGQALALEVVGLMMDNIGNDSRLLPEVRRALRELEPTMLRLALVDPRFFSDKHHPARQFLDEITRRSLAWQSAQSEGFTKFLALVRQAVQVLGTTKNVGPEPFAYALQSLDKIWTEQRNRDKAKRERAVQALLHAEQRNEIAVQVGHELKKRAQAATAPPEIVQFLVGPWAQVIAQARMSSNEEDPDPAGYEDLVTDLVWSAIPAAASANKKRLAQLVPTLVERLNAGLASIDYPGVKTRHFLELLSDLHAHALNPAHKLPPRATLSARELLDAQLRADDDASMWLAPSEAQESGFVDTQPAPSTLPPVFDETQPGFKHTRSAAASEAATAASFSDAVVQAQAALAALEPGTWIELQLDHEWTRTQLTWASPHGALFMFTNADGANQSLTQQALAQLAARGGLRLVDDLPVVEGALDAVAQAALRNSAQLKP